MTKQFDYITSGGTIAWDTAGTQAKTAVVIYAKEEASNSDLREAVELINKERYVIDKITVFSVDSKWKKLDENLPHHIL